MSHTNSVLNIQVETDGLATNKYLHDILNKYLSASSIDGGNITDNGNGTVSIAKIEVMLRDLGITEGDLKVYSIGPTTNIALTDLDINYIYADYNDGTPQFSVYSGFPDTGGYDQTPLYIIYRDGNALDIVSLKDFSKDHVNSSSRKEFLKNGFEHIPGGTLFSSSTRHIALTPGIFFLTSVQTNHGSFNTGLTDTFTRIYGDTATGWTRVSGETQIDNLNYWNSTTHTLDPMNNNRYGTRYLYLILGENPRLVTLIGHGNYTSLAAAEAEGVPADTPPELAQYGVSVLVGKIILQQGAAEVTEFQSALIIALATETPTTHDDLAGIDVATIQHINIVTSPPAGYEGQVIYDSTDKKLKFYNGTAWETVTSAVI